MADTPLFGRDERVDEIEALLRELDDADVELHTPPPAVWSGIEAELATEPVDLRSRRARFTTRALAAAAALAVVFAGAAIVGSLSGDDDEPVLATAELTYDAEAFDPAGADASATAALIERDGRFEIRLDEAALPQPGPDEDLELWLIAVAEDGSLDVQPIAFVDPADPGTYLVPAELDPGVHSIVDISVEPRDGDETHSGRSILRGALDDV